MKQGLHKLPYTVGSFLHAMTSRISELLAKTSEIVTSTGNANSQLLALVVPYIKRQRVNSFSKTFAIVVIMPPVSVKDQLSPGGRVQCATHAV